MEAMRASSRRLCQMVQDAGQWLGTEERLQTVLAAASTICLFDASFTYQFKEVLVRFIDKFTVVKKLADDLALLLQPARPSSSLPATLLSLYGDNLFHALVALRLPTIATKNANLEVVLAAQRLAQQETIDLHTHVYKRIVYMGHYRAKDDARTLTCFNRWEGLDAFVEKHVDLATKAVAPHPAAGGPAH